MSTSDDDRWRNLVDRAVAEAPPAPTLSDIRRRSVGGAGGPVARATGPARRWTAPVAAGLVLVASLGALLLLGRDPESVSTAQPTASADVTVSDGDRVEPTPSVTTPDESTVQPDTVIVVGGLSGVTVSAPGRPSQPVIDRPVVIAEASDDGRVVAQRTFDGPDAGRIVVRAPGAEAETALDVPNPTNGALVLHDVATIGGQLSVLYEYGPTSCDVDADDCDVSLTVYEPDTGRSTDLVTLNGARNDWTTLSLSDSGLVVGELTGDDGTSFYAGSAGAEVEATIPAAGDLGLALAPPGCSNCPRGYVIDRSGRFVAWRQGPDVVVVDLDQPARRVVARDTVPELGQGPDGDLVLDVGGLATDGDTIRSGLAAFSTLDGTRSVVVDLSDGSAGVPADGTTTLT